MPTKVTEVTHQDFPEKLRNAERTCLCPRSRRSPNGSHCRPDCAVKVRRPSPEMGGVEVGGQMERSSRGAGGSQGPGPARNALICRLNWVDCRRSRPSATGLPKYDPGCEVDGELLSRSRSAQDSGGFASKWGNNRRHAGPGPCFARSRRGRRNSIQRPLILRCWAHR
jgi:hypothetical protein